MPTYEYACRECGQHLEVVQSFTDDPLETCERCGGPLRKVFSAAGIIFKGSGYYVTDTRATRTTTSSSGSSPSSDGSSESSSGADSSSKRDTSSGSDNAGSPSSAKAGDSKSA